MKRITLFPIAAAMLFSGVLTAQQNKIYFEPGKHELTTEGKAALNQIITEAKKISDFDLDITAFTDDIGTVSYNKDLATRRAQTVRQYLDAAGVRPTEIIQKGVGELALSDNHDVDAQRRENRRVEIKLTPFEPKTLADFFQYNARRTQQQFTVRLDKDTTIVARKGTELFIPARSLQLVGGGEVASSEVVITLREAYTYQEMLFNNLATVSNGQMIETGGMVYIEARTLDGRELEIKPGEELGLSMVSNKKLPEDMQLFYADHGTEAVPQSVNWNATNNPFSSDNFDEEEPDFNFSAIEMPNIPKIKAPNLPEWPKLALSEPKMPSAPKEPTMRPESVPSKETLKAENPKKEGESEKKYAERIAQLQKNLEKDIAQNIKINASAKKHYEQSLASYEQAMQKYEQDKANYVAYQARIESIRTDLIVYRSANIDWFDSFRWSDDFNKKLLRVVGSIRRLDEYKKYLRQECRRFGLKSDLATIDNLAVEEEKVLKTVAVAFARCLRANYDFYNNHHLGDVKIKVEELLQVSKTNQNLFDQGRAQQVYSMMMGTYEHATLLNNLIDNYNTVLNKSGFIAEAADLDSTCQKLDEIRTKIFNIKQEKGLLSTKDMSKVYRNTTNINKLGWINCDRFTKTAPEDLMTVKVQQEQPEEVQIFLTFESVNGTMVFSRDNNNKNTFIASNLPKNEKVRMVAMRVRNGRMEVAIHNALVKDIKENVKLTYKVYTLQELRTLLA